MVGAEGESLLDRQRITLLDPPNKDWKWGGLEYLGGIVRLDENAESIRQRVDGQESDPTEFLMRARLGGLLLVAVGFSDEEISNELGISDSYVARGLAHVRGILSVEANQRHMLLRKAISRRVLNIETYGPNIAFTAAKRQFVKLGLLSCVGRDFVQAAFGITRYGLYTEISRLSESQNVLNLGGCISAAMVTHQIGPRTGIPLVQSKDAKFGVAPMVSVEKWDTLVDTKTKESFVERFRELELHMI